MRTGPTAHVGRLSMLHDSAEALTALQRSQFLLRQVVVHSGHLMMSGLDTIDPGGKQV